MQPRDINLAHIGFLNAWLVTNENAFTRHCRCGRARQVLRHLAENYGASPALVKSVLKTAAPKPRNVTATREERSAILAASPPNLRLWLLLCSDLGIRSGTAATIGPQNYDEQEGVLTFRTKYQNAQQMHVTEEIRELVRLSGSEPSIPFVAQMPHRGGRYGRPIRNAKALGNAYMEVKRKCGITRKLTPHDLRRTTARSVYKITKDLRIVQAFLGHSDLASTVWYLQDNLTEVPLSTLELAKLNVTTEVVQ